MVQIKKEDILLAPAAANALQLFCKETGIALRDIQFLFEENGLYLKAPGAKHYIALNEEDWTPIHEG